MIVREVATAAPYAWEVYEGLTKKPRSLPPKLFYDAAGSALFERITELPEYYLTRTELAILEEFAGEIVAKAGQGLRVVELGSGTAAKTVTLLRAMERRQLRVDYFPVDISTAALSQARERVKQMCPRTHVQSVVADLGADFSFLGRIAGRKLVLFLGSTIGNFDLSVAAESLGKLREQLAPGDALLLGTDLAKSQNILLPAYDDSSGVTAAFNKNILSRLNRELAADFDVDAFRHIADWSAAQSRMEMYLESQYAKTIHIRAIGLELEFAKGERIHTENSYKYTLPMVSELFGSAGFALEKSWFDAKCWYAVHLARA
jgi:dimethylhistidine N-methyltransferase